MFQNIHIVKNGKISKIRVKPHSANIHASKINTVLRSFLVNFKGWQSGRQDRLLAGGEELYNRIEDVMDSEEPETLGVGWITGCDDDYNMEM